MDQKKGRQNSLQRDPLRAVLTCSTKRCWWGALQRFKRTSVGRRGRSVTTLSRSGGRPLIAASRLHKCPIACANITLPALMYDAVHTRSALWLDVGCTAATARGAVGHGTAMDSTLGQQCTGGRHMHPGSTCWPWLCCSQLTPQRHDVETCRTARSRRC